MRDYCTYCGIFAEKLEVEHVFPSSWCPKGTAGKITVPACSKCNREFGYLEQDLRRILSAASDPMKPGVEYSWTKELKFISPSKGKNAQDSIRRRGRLKKFIGNVEFITLSEAKEKLGQAPPNASWGKTAGGIYVLGVPAVLVPEENINKLCAKFVRGLYRHETKNIFPADTEFMFHQITPTYYKTIKKQVQELGQTAGIPPYFRYRWGCKQEDPRYSIWLFMIWETHVFYGYTISSQKPTFFEKTLADK